MLAITLLVLVVSLQIILGSGAIVPQVPLCNWENCPTVSRIGLGTLHIGDKIGGISDPKKINEWINNGVDLGITLFDTADVSSRQSFCEKNLFNLFSLGLSS
jgi:predicted oxidoreductase